MSRHTVSLAKCHLNNLPLPNGLSVHIRQVERNRAIGVLQGKLQGLTNSEVHHFTGINERTLQCLQSTYQDTGGVSCESPGRLHVFTVTEAKLPRDCVKRQPNMGLQMELREAFNAKTSSVLQTIPDKLEKQSPTARANSIA
ncbi:hypothetical protein EDB83DRAFT_2520026 [Lactarius deliciosus]|nr:hypothetical protein EDB83DRAFT_2520026 [Lactarius deliciosus]